MDAPAVTQAHGEPPVVALERHRLERHREARVEFLRLQGGPRRQLGSGDPRREAEVVLDPRGGGRLTADRETLDRLRVEALRGAVDRGGEPRGPGADDHDVAQRRRRAARADPEHTGELGGAGPQQHTTRADDDRGLRGLDADGAQELLHGRVGLDIHPLVRHAVAHEELAQAAGPLREARADDPHPGARGDQLGAARKKRAEHDARELLVLVDERADRGRRDPQDLAAVAHDGGQGDARAGQEAELAEEATRAEHGEDAVLPAEACDDRDHPREHDVEVLGLVALAEEHLAGRDRAPVPERGEAPELVGGQGREGAMFIGLLETGAERIAQRDGGDPVGIATS